MTNIILAISAFFTALATIAIAYFTKTNIELTKTIKGTSDQHQENMKILQIELAAVSLFAAVNPPGKPLSSESLNGCRKIITNSLQ